MAESLKDPGSSVAVATPGQRDPHRAALFAPTPVGLAELAPDGRFRHVNDVLGELLGRSGDALLALRLADVTHPDDGSTGRSACERVLASGAPAGLAVRYVWPDGPTATRRPVTCVHIRTDASCSLGCSRICSAMRATRSMCCVNAA